MKNLPIRWQLAAFYTALLTVILLVLGLLLYANVDGFLVNNTASSVVAPARNIITQQEGLGEPRDGGKPPPNQSPNSAGGNHPPDFNRIVALIRSQLPIRDARIWVYNRNAQVVVRDDGEADKNSTGLPHATWPSADATLVGAALDQPPNLLPPAVQNLSDGSGRILSVYLPIHQRPGNDVVGVVVISVSMVQPDAVLLWLRWAIPLGIVAAMLLCFLLGVPLARTLLRPLGRVVGAANRIATGDFAARAGVEGGNEVGQLAQSFDTMAERVQTGFAAQRQFVADASHELKTPLTALSGEVEMLQTGADGGNPAARHRLLGSMERELGRMSRLVADLLTLSRLDSEAGGSIAPAQMNETVDIVVLCREVIEQTERLAPNHHISSDIPTSALLVRGNADRLRQVLLNLADNARKFTPPEGNISFRITTNGQYASISIADSGIGIAPTDLAHVFDRFYRSDPSRTRDQRSAAVGGSGLGLAIAQAIAQAHGGSLSAASALGEGSTFTLVLPLIS